MKMLKRQLIFAKNLWRLCLRCTLPDAPVTHGYSGLICLPQAEFAFLSSCHTAVGDEQTPDGLIHLAADLQFSGFKSTIGTLWEVDDAVAKHVVEAFYEKMLKNLEDGVMDCTSAARVLNHAMYAVKKKVQLQQRIGFIYIDRRHFFTIPSVPPYALGHFSLHALCIYATLYENKT
ncbi:hypothetical protein EDB19DRAFT_1717351 [Suillus lakei]|nr:hypothetical protein EDB19DRAFT_1717351 [Suillus lakei]